MFEMNVEQMQRNVEKLVESYLKRWNSDAHIVQSALELLPGENAARLHFGHYRDVEISLLVAAGNLGVFRTLEDFTENLAHNIPWVQDIKLRIEGAPGIPTGSSAPLIRNYYEDILAREDVWANASVSSYYDALDGEVLVKAVALNRIYPDPVVILVSPFPSQDPTPIIPADWVAYRPVHQRPGIFSLRLDRRYPSGSAL